jgi:uncharacterized protein (DUF1810 family)
MEKFVDIQNYEYQKAYKEIKEGKKTSHWIWYIFPQIAGLGYSYISRNYEIRSLDEAMEYLKDDYLRNNLINISKALLEHKAKKNICDIMDDPLDAQKLLSCMTLFKEANKYLNYEDIFSNVINTFYNGKEDMRTIKILKEMNNNSSSFNYNNNKNKYPYTTKYFNNTRLPEEKYINISGDCDNRQSNIDQLKKNDVEVKENGNFYSGDVNNQRTTFSFYNGNEKDFKYDSNIYRNNILHESLVFANNNEKLHQYPSNNYHHMKGNIKINGQIMANNNISCWNNNISKDNFNSQHKFDNNIRSNRKTSQNNNNFFRKKY